MASCLNFSVLACSYALSSTADLNQKLGLKPVSSAPGQTKFPVIKAQQAKVPEGMGAEGRKAAFAILAATILSTSVVASSASAGIIDDYLEISKANKELNDKKRLATSGANFARAYTVQFGTCKFPYNFTGCQDLAKTKKVPFLSDDIELECQGKDKYKCGSNVFWKW
uniref:Photosystem I reaction center subunit N, chloroplastic n=1 Tax=Kalanchoe fedtschenkoi TaxID=63787 RepID=A0A7N0TGF7_KALFE